ncbi:A24 family peptidase [Paraburkholderia humisilvae]|nr:A24 family peptidase [Paraburkholderia humisilvae]
MVLVERVLFIVWTAAVAVCDLRGRRVRNVLVLAGLAVALASALTARAPFGVAAGPALLGAAAGLAALLPFFALRVMGAADVKVFAVLGAWCGLRLLPELWLIASLLASVHAAGVLIATRTRVAALIRRGTPTFELHGYRATPYATCLSAAAWICLVVHMPGGAAP